MKDKSSKKRLERVEKAISQEAEAEHSFKIAIAIGLSEEHGGTKYFVDDKEVSKKVFDSYPKDKTGVDIRVRLVGDEENS